MSKNPKFQRLMFMMAGAGVLAAVTTTACLEDVCAERQVAEFRTMDSSWSSAYNPWPKRYR